MDRHGETFTYELEPQNINDPYAVKVIFHGVVVGHVPRFLSKITTYLLKAGGKVEATVTGTRQKKRKKLVGSPV